jgi:parvulin-like peptidyl-prolyl isomerase
LSTAVPAAPNALALTSASPSKLFQPAETLARVGDEYIVRGDIMGDVELILSQLTSKMSPEQREASRVQLEGQRQNLRRILLKQAVDRKLMFIEFMRDIPTDKLKEVRTNIDTKVGEAFGEELQEMVDEVQRASEDEYGELAKKEAQLFRLALTMKERNVTSTLELDRILRAYGTSLPAQQKAYAERKLGQQQMVKSVNFQPEVTHDEMLQYYREHENEFRVPTRARWEQLTAAFGEHEDRAQCGQAIADMGNEVVLGGAPFWAVAKRRSDGPTADQGGDRGWTNWGDLTLSRPLLNAVFTLPVQQLSGIIEDHEGLHIIQVIERHEAHLRPFRDSEVQDEIKQQLIREKRNAQIAEYVAGLHKRTLVWTIYDDGPPPDARTAHPDTSRPQGLSR